jgi:PKD repeat protein
LTSGSDYKIKITDTSNSSYYDYSDGNFTITDQSTCTITVSYPNGGETLYKGSTYNITWSKSGSACGSNVKIELYKGGSYNSTITSSTSNNGSYSWTIPSSLTSGSDYKIKITDTSNSSYYDYSDGNFTITDQSTCTIAISYPNGGETLYKGSTYNITWSKSGSSCGSNVGIELYKNAVFYSFISTSTQNDSSYTWEVPSSISEGSNYKIRIVDLSNRGAFDYSDGNFSILSGGTPPTADFTWEPANPKVGEPVNFKDKSTGNRNKAKWDFENDGIIDSYFFSPSFVFKKEGTYKVKFTVGNNAGESSIIKDVVVSSNPNLIDLSIYEVEISQGVQTLKFDGNKNFRTNWGNNYCTEAEWDLYDNCNPIFTNKKTIIRVFPRSDKKPFENQKGSTAIYINAKLYVDGKEISPKFKGKILNSCYNENCNSWYFSVSSSELPITFIFGGISAGIHNIKIEINPEGSDMIVEATHSNNIFEFKHKWIDPPNYNFKAGIMPFETDSNTGKDWSSYQKHANLICQWIKSVLPYKEIECKVFSQVQQVSDIGIKCAALQRIDVVDSVRSKYCKDCNLLLGLYQEGSYCLGKSVDGAGDLTCNNGNLEKCVNREGCDGFGTAAWVHYLPGYADLSILGALHEILHTRQIIHNNCQVNTPLLNSYVSTDKIEDLILNKGDLSNIMEYNWTEEGLRQKNFMELINDVSSLREGENYQDAWVINGYFDGEIPKIDSLDHYKTEISKDEGPYLLIEKDCSGNKLYETHFDIKPTSLPEDIDYKPFRIAVPYNNLACNFTILVNGVESFIYQRSSNSPTIKIISPSPNSHLFGEFEVRWNANDLDGDELFFDLSYSTDNGLSWMPIAVSIKANSIKINTSNLKGSDNIILKVICTDGFNFSEDKVEGLSIDKKKPNIKILQPKNEEIIQTKMINAISYFENLDISDESIDFVNWYLDSSGLSVHNIEIEIEDLEIGKHNLKVEAQLKDGTKIFDEVVFYVSDSASVDIGNMKSYNYIIPASAHSAGAEGTNWQSDVVILNPADSNANINLYFLSAEADNRYSQGTNILLNSKNSIFFEDIVKEIFKNDPGSGAILISSDNPLNVSSRTFNNIEKGTYGQYILSFEMEKALKEGDEGLLIQLTKNNRYRTNIGFVNASNIGIEIVCKFYMGNGDILGTDTITLQPYGFLQKNNPIGNFTSDEIDDAYAIVSSNTKDAKYFAYASVVDNISGDPIFIPVSKILPDDSLNYYIPASAKTSGAYGTNWLTDIVINNPNNSNANVKFYFLKAGEDNSNPISANLIVNSKNSLKISDAIGTLFGLNNISGAIIVESNIPLIITSRTYNDQGNEGTYGQFISGISENYALRKDEKGKLIHLQKNSNYRTNIGFVNASEFNISINVDLFNSDGQPIGSRTYNLKPYEYFQEANIINLLTSSDVNNAYAYVSTTTENARFFAYASIIDNRTGDPIFIPAK